MIAEGGLHILGTERHESRRIDNQLRGRSGRQGDPGSSRFYVSLEDEIMRIFGSDRISPLARKAGHGRGYAHRAPPHHEGHRERPDKGGVAQLRHKKVPPRIRQRDEQAARDHLRHAQGDNQRRRHEGAGRRDGGRASSKASWTSTRRRRSTRRNGTSTSLKNRIYETFFFHIDLDHLDFKSITKAGLLDMVKTSVLSVYEAKEKEFGEVRCGT